MVAALIGKIEKEEDVKLKLEIPKSLYENILIYTHYVGGNEEDISVVIRKMAEYVIERESKGVQGKKFKEFKQKFIEEKAKQEKAKQVETNNVK